MNKNYEFKQECLERISGYSENLGLKKAANDFMYESTKPKYSYNFTWMGRPVIQYPQDMVAMQEIIWDVKPDLIIETGIAHGGSLIMYASYMEMMNLNPGQVLGIDLDIRAHNREEIENHPMFKRISMIEGSSVSGEVFSQVQEFAKDYSNIMVILDSNHTHEHVLKELELYSELVTIDNYCIVFDTIVEDLPENTYPSRPWNVGNNPKTAVHEFLKNNKNFAINENIQNKLLITVAPDGYLKRVK